jgi:hypothetical protein
MRTLPAIGLGAGLISATLAPAPGADSAAWPASRENTNLPPLRMVGRGILELGRVRVDKEKRTASFPAVLNQAEGVVEYLVVTAYGKTHESVLRTEVPPFHLHVAMLLLGAQGAGTNFLTAKPPEYGGTPGLKIPGDQVTIELSWPRQKRQVVRQAGEVVSRGGARPGKGRSQWVYNGSAVWQGIFLAEDSGSMVSLISDPAALVNHAVAASTEERAWMANPKKLPPVNTPVQVTVKLENLKTTTAAQPRIEQPNPPTPR